MIVSLESWDKQIIELLSKDNPKTDCLKIFKIHQRQIAYLQHERLIHLLVMLFIGLYLMILVALTFLLLEIQFLLIDYLAASVLVA